MKFTHPDKSLGQHWLYDDASLQAVADAADVGDEDIMLEIGAGLGTLTRVLLERGAHVTAVEFDPALAERLPDNVLGEGLTVVSQDILRFDFSTMPTGYKIVGNIPYYLSSRLIRVLLELENRPQKIGLLVQKEVAQRVVAQPGDMSVLSVAAQLYARCSLGPIVPADLFQPPPKVDSQVVSLLPHDRVDGLQPQLFFRVVKAGFGERRKKLVNSLAGGLRLSKTEVLARLEQAGIPESARAQELTITQWRDLANRFTEVEK